MQPTKRKKNLTTLNINLRKQVDFDFGFVDRRVFTTYAAAKQWAKEYMVEDDTIIVEQCEITTMTLER